VRTTSSTPCRLLLLGFLAATASCGRGQRPLIVGLAGPFSEVRGRSMLHAAQLAAREINDRGGVRGRPLELLVRDDSASPSRAVAIAAELRDDPRIVAVVGHLTSGATLPAAVVYNQGSRPVVNITPSASTTELTGIGPYTFRVCAREDLHGTALAEWAYTRIGARSVAVVYTNDDRGRGVLTTFAAEFARRGGTLTERDPVLPEMPDVAPYLERIRRRGQAQAIVLSAPPALAARFLRLARERRLRLPMLSTDAISGIQTEGDIAEGLYISSEYLPEIATPANAAFLRAYSAAYPGEIPDHRGAGTYDALRLVAGAIEDAGTSRRAVRDGLRRLGRGRDAFEGVTGRITFDGQGEVPGKRVHVGVLQGGRLVAVRIW
jgi:branched-chain amino acid transport system substrate-binding protein